MAVIGQTSPGQSTTTLALPENIKVTRTALLATTETAHVLQADVQKLMIRAEAITTTLRVAWGAGDTATNYITIERGVVYNIEGVKLNGSLYIYASAADTVQIEEIY